MKTFITLLLLLSLGSVKAADLFVEAESFSNKGGWKVDQQFMDLMGSPYLLAHGMGVPVDDASTEVTFPEKGEYYVYVRTYNWTSPWKKGEGPGKFSLSVGGKKMTSPLGAEGSAWMWQIAGKVSVKNLKTVIKLHDLTGFDGRCDAIYFTTEAGKMPPSDIKELEAFRRKALGLPDEAPVEGKYDLVVVGAGIAGMSAAVSAGRLGCKVALINDRPVVGGNNSSEIRVHLGGRIEEGTYKELGGLQKEFGPEKGGNAQPAEYYEDQKKMDWLAGEKNVSLFLNYRAIGVTKEGDKITSVVVKHIESGKELKFEAPLFSDCTGDGTIGYLAGADYRMGREGRDEYGESIAPEKADKLTMGSSVQWYSVDNKKSSPFPEFSYGVEFNDKNCEKVMMGEWTWETGMQRDQVWDAERIRDHGLLVVYANWSYLKNHALDNGAFRNLALEWVAYVAGKRESRRLMGDVVLTQNDILRQVAYEDASVTTSWTIDLHYPDPKNTRFFSGDEFKAVCNQEEIELYPIPYRCFYSRNVSNLFMAGRNISVTHVALGTVRVMRTTAMMGEVVGMAAAVCRRHDVLPRTVYTSYLPELRSLMQKGCGQQDLPNNQQFNIGRRKHH